MLDFPRVKIATTGGSRKEALKALKNAERVVEHLELAFELMAGDDPTQPAIKHLYAALCEAEIRASILEDWYERTYRSLGLGPQQAVAQGVDDL